MLLEAVPSSPFACSGRLMSVGMTTNAAHQAAAARGNRASAEVRGGTSRLKTKLQSRNRRLRRRRSDRASGEDDRKPDRRAGAPRRRVRASAGSRTGLPAIRSRKETATARSRYGRDRATASGSASRARDRGRRRRAETRRHARGPDRRHGVSLAVERPARQKPRSPRRRLPCADRSTARR